MDAVAKKETQESALGQIVITQDQVELIKHTVARDATDDELKLYFFECRRRGVHPLDRLVHFIKRDGKVTFQTSIDLFRSQAEDTGEYRGQKDIEYGEIIEADGGKVPEWAKATIKRYDPITKEILEVSATAYWKEYYPGEKLGFMWRKMPRGQLGKCAEALALRKAFPRKLAGLYTFDEMVLTDMIDQGKKTTKTSTVKPGTGEQGGNGDKLTVRDTFKAELSAYCQGDHASMAAVLHDLTMFQGDVKNDKGEVTGKKEIAMSLAEIDTAKEAWVGKSLGKLRDRVKAEEKKDAAE